MAIYIEFSGNNNQIQVATNTGWGDFGRWVDTLTGYPEMKALREIGESSGIPELRAELEAVLEKSPPADKYVLEVADALITAIDTGADADTDIILVTNGLVNEPE